VAQYEFDVVEEGNFRAGMQFVADGNLKDTSYN
jgi:hypothetical protein